MEAELIALASTSEEEIWFRDLLYKIPPILIHCDCTDAIGSVKNYFYNDKSRPIRRKHNTMWFYLSSGIIIVDYIKSNDNLADPFTKAWAKGRVWNTLRGMGLKFRGSWAMYEDTKPKDQRSWEFGSMGKTNHIMVVRNALFISSIIYFVNNFLIVHPYDVSAFIL